jgi:hypothetical protein
MPIRGFLDYSIWQKVPLTDRDEIIRKFQLNSPDAESRFDEVINYIKQKYSSNSTDPAGICIPLTKNSDGYKSKEPPKVIEPISQSKANLTIEDDKVISQTKSQKEEIMQVKEPVLMNKKLVYLNIPGFMVLQTKVYDYLESENDRFILVIHIDSAEQKLKFNPRTEIQIATESKDKINAGTFQFVDNFIFENKFQFIIFERIA